MYRVLRLDTGPAGIEGMEYTLNEWAARGFSLVHAVKGSTYDWVLFLKYDGAGDLPACVAAAGD
ncbi:hypothetical protein GOL30_26350 [Sinorhizobium medicae]|nr:hypothetical protein [Sinorhizobium medicae]MDX0992079.1 hypothetical protein [Sinorhizobium medicae]MDX1078211.1 hypothetical protein [Sinorhizobium medicae]